VTQVQNHEATFSEQPWRGLPPEVATALRPGMPGLADEMIDEIRRAVPAYARPLEGSFGVAIRVGVEQALTDFLDGVEGKEREADTDGRDIYHALGRGEAREGRTMEALLAAYRVGARVAWRRSAEAGRRAGFDADTLSELAEAFFAYIDELSARSAQGFAEEQSAFAGEAARRRRALLGLLIQTPPVEAVAIQAAAREAGWEAPSTLAALIWRDRSEQPVDRRLPLGSLAAPLEDELVCALVPDPEAPGRRAELEGALGRRRGALGPSVPPAKAWLSASRARAVHRLMAGGLLGDDALVVADEHLSELIVHADPGLVHELARRRLKPLDQRTEGSRARLLETLTAWLDHQGNVPRVAESLHVHPQTVRYRLTQLRELFGEALEDPGSRFELGLAVRGVNGAAAP
jgi:PucR C-terminal helix-turn-helix domain